jgi:hypothetical protein
LNKTETIKKKNFKYTAKKSERPKVAQLDPARDRTENENSYTQYYYYKRISNLIFKKVNYKKA